MATSCGAKSDAAVANCGSVSTGNGNGNLNGVSATARVRVGGDENSGGVDEEGEPWEKVENRRRQIKNGKRPMQFGGNGGQGRSSGSGYTHAGRIDFIGRQHGPSIHIAGGRARQNNVQYSKSQVGQRSNSNQNLNSKSVSATFVGKGSINCTPKTFKETLIGQTSVNSTAKYYKPESDGSETFAKVNKIARINNEKKWKNAIYLYVVGKRPYFLHLKAFIERTWGLKGAIEIFSRENGFYLVKFDLEEDLLKVIDGGPWMFDGKPMIIKKWETNLKLDRDLLLTLPIWVRFPHLNLSLWDEENICRLASVVGRPIRMDEPTRKATRLNYARILIDMDTESTKKKVIKAITEDGETYMQEVEFEYIPPCCEQCKCFGHFKNICPLLVRCTKCLGFGHETETCSMRWVPVSKSPTDAGDNSKKEGVTFAEDNAECTTEIPASNLNNNVETPIGVTDMNKLPVTENCAKVAEDLVEVHSGDSATNGLPLTNDLKDTTKDPVDEDVLVEPTGSDEDNNAQCKSVVDTGMTEIFHDTTEDLNATELQNEKAVTFEQINEILECMQVKIKEKQDTVEQSNVNPVAMQLKAHLDHAITSDVHHLNPLKDVGLCSLLSSDSAAVHVEKDATTEAVHRQSSGVPSPPKVSVPSEEPAEQPTVHQESVAQIPLSEMSLLSSQDFLCNTDLSSNLLHSTSNITDIKNGFNIMNSTVQVLEPRGGQDVTSRDEYDKSLGTKEPVCAFPPAYGPSGKSETLVSSKAVQRATPKYAVKS